MTQCISLFMAIITSLTLWFPAMRDACTKVYNYKLASPAGLSEFTPPEKGKEDGADFYVSPGGDDTADGSFARPFATIERARDAVRGLEKTKDITVALMAGEYSVNGLEFTAADSGNENCTVRYVSYGDGEVVLNGGVTLKNEDFKAVTERSQLERLSKKAQKNVVCADLTAYGLTAADWGRIYTIGSFSTAAQYTGDWTGGLYCELFVNDERQTIARYPNEGYLYTGEVVKEGEGKEGGNSKRLGNEWYAIRDPEPDVYEIDKKLTKRIASWETLDDVWMFGFWRYDWADASTPVGEFNEEERTLSPKFVSLYGADKDKPYYFFNVFEELDAPGEWYLDRNTGVLYLYPSADLSTAVIGLSISEKPIITVSGADYLTFDGLTVKGTRSDGMLITGNNVTVRDCVIKNVAGSAVYADGYNNLVFSNEITRTGKSGITLTGGDRATLTPGNNVADNNLIHDWAEIYQTYQPGVTLGGVGNICSHNEMYNCPHEAVTWSGNDHIIEYNYIHHVCLLSDDAGAIYSGRRWDWYGTKIRYNCVADLGSGDHKPCGIYLDDALSGQEVTGNLLVNVPSYGIQLGGGRDLKVEDNVLVNCHTDASVEYDQRAIDGVFGGWFNHSSMENGDMWTLLYESPWQTDVWKNAYPAMTRFSNDISNTDNSDFVPNPAYSSVKNNIILNITHDMKHIEEKAYQYSDISNNPVCSIWDAKKIFTDAKHGDYTVKADAEVLNGLSAYDPIPISEIGRY